MGYRRFLLSIYIVISYKRPRIPADSIVPKKSTDGDGSKKIRGFPADQTTVPITNPQGTAQVLGKQLYLPLYSDLSHRTENDRDIHIL